jgi:chemotaxis protein histidine kinase CheA
MATRTSTRHAAQKAKEAISAAPDTKRRGPVGTKRKGPTEKAPEPKREKKDIDKVSKEAEKKEPEKTPEQKVEPEEKKEEKESQAEVKQQEKPTEEPQAGPKTQPEAELDEQPNATSKEPSQDKPEEKSEKRPDETPEKPKESETKQDTAADGTEGDLKTSQKREEIVPSNILEKGIIYFFYRGRVNTQEAHSMQDVARSFFVLRPTPLGAAVDPEQGAVDTGAKCRLLMLPKKKYPRSGKEREMGFVEKSNVSVKELQESFIAGDTYETSTRGTREVPEAKPYAEGVYAITSTKRATHLVYHITLPEQLGEIQEDFGLSNRGSWLLQSKNPKFPGPPNARLPKEPEFPAHIQEKFKDYRWIPTEPELLEFPNAQFLMVGSATGDFGKAATAESGDKRPEEEQPEEELVKMEDENESRIEALGGDHAIYQDLGYHAKEKYSKLETTWQAGHEEGK